MRILRPSLATATTLVLLACGGSGGATPAENDPAITAVIDSLLTVAMAGSREANAAKVLSIADGSKDFTFVTGDVQLSGLDSTRAAFARTYAAIKRQDQTVLTKRVRVLSPDVAVLMATAEGTYTDSAGVVSQPVGIGLTVVFVKHDGRWVAEHAHQSVIP